MNTTFSYERYHRQLILKDFGETAQQKLLNAAVLIIGAGGLGCPVMQYLAAAGVGRMGIVDNDIVSLSNLHRQVLYNTNDIGHPKAQQAANVLKKLNPEIDIVSFFERLSTQNAFSLINGFDIVIDCTDNFASRYLINDACVLMNKPLIFGAVSRYEGQVAIFNYKSSAGSIAVNYRDLYPHPPKNGEIQNCEEAGVLGVLPGIIGTMQASETIKLITGIGRPLINCLLTYDALNNNMYEMELVKARDSDSLIPANEIEFMQTDYEQLCGSVQNEDENKFEIDFAYFEQLVSGNTIDIIDVRALNEVPLIEEFPCYRIPLNELAINMHLLKNDTIVTICQSGQRSLLAAKQLTAFFGDSKKIYSLWGGVSQWKQLHQKQLS